MLQRTWFRLSTSTGVAGRKKVTSLELLSMRKSNQRISMVACYDYPSAFQCDEAGIDVILVGDSVGMVELGLDTTQSVTMDMMIHHAKAVAKGARRPLLVGDMPMGSYEVCPKDALRNALRFIKEGNVDCVKMEGATAERVEAARMIVQGGIAVMGHIGLTPQSISTLGGFRAQGRTYHKALGLIEEAKKLQDVGCFALVIECVPPEVAKAITDSISIPTIGIGSGPHCSGQVLVYHDMLGLLHHPHHAKFCPKFCKQYANVGAVVRNGLEQFRKEVQEGSFPSKEHTPYTMPAAELAKFADKLNELNAKENMGKSESPLTETDEYGVLNLYGTKGNEPKP
eukprot:PhF_6_TR42733/c1_g1_i2/m.64577/K00606/panB; 3-methyl-2-oxobutanoate hydroxymethyltransferase